MIFAYIDPGSGSMVFQMLIAAALAVPFFLREQISRGISRLRGRSVSADEETSKGNG